MRRTNEAPVNHLKLTTIASAVLAAGLAFAAPALAQQAPGPDTSDNQTTGTDTTRALFIRSVTRMDMMTQTLGSLTNHIPQKNIVPIAVERWTLTPDEHQALMTTMTPDRMSALRGAMDKATVAMEDRPNGASEDQHSLTDYMKHLGIDPRGVIAIDVNTRRDPENPMVTVFYRRGAMHGQQGGPG